jgi:hypothetical protein
MHRLAAVSWGHLHGSLPNVNAMCACVVAVLQDMVSGLLDSCLSTCSSISGPVISKAADLLQGIAPAGAPRHKVWMARKHQSLNAQAGKHTACCPVHSLCVETAAAEARRWHA